MNRLLKVAVAVCFSGAAMSANAALSDRGNGLIYDSTLNVTWLADANLSKTQTFGVNNISPNNSQAGDMSWYTAQSWLAGMNASNYLGYSDWRLPTVKPVNGSYFDTSFSTNGTTDIGYNITSTNSEMSHLYYVDDLRGNGLFQNIQLSYGYYSGTVLSANSTTVFEFVMNRQLTIGSQQFSGGFQGVGDKAYSAVTMVLRDGDVAAVPEPETYGMMLAGLGLMGFVARRRKTSQT